MSKSAFERLTCLLQERNVHFEVLRHIPVFTSEAAAATRGTPLSSGAKALVCKVDERFALFVLPGDRKLDSKQVRQALGVHGLRFATAEELLQLTGLAPGAVPPFGQLFGLPTYCDSRLTATKQINFNAGDHGISVSMLCADYLQVENPVLGTYTA